MKGSYRFYCLISRRKRGVSCQKEEQGSRYSTSDKLSRKQENTSRLENITGNGISRISITHDKDIIRRQYCQNANGKNSFQNVWRWGFFKTRNHTYYHSSLFSVHDMLFKTLDTRSTLRKTLRKHRYRHISQQNILNTVN